MLHKVITVVSLLFLAGCASSPYTYYVEPSPIEKGFTKYFLGDVKVNLSLGRGAIEGDTTFASQDKLTQQFITALQKHLKNSSILASSTDAKTATVDITIDYTRRFNIGGKALNKPRVSHSVDVRKGGKKLASFGLIDYTTKYGYLKDAAVNFEIAAFSWDAKDEPKDVDLIASSIVEDLSGLGR